MDNNQEDIDTKVKIFNFIFLADMAVGSIAGLSTTFISGLNISELHKAHLLVPFIATGLIALTILSIYTIFDQYHRIGTTFQDSRYKLTAEMSFYLCFFGIIINLSLLTSVIVLLCYAIKSPLSILATGSTSKIGMALLFIGICCLMQSLYIALSLVKWNKNFKAILCNKNASFSAYNRMLVSASRGSGANVELMLGWVFFSLGFLFLSLKSFDLIHLNNFLMTAFISISLFSTSILFLLVSHMGGHPNNECLRKTHIKISYATKFFVHHFEKSVANSINTNEPLLPSHEVELVETLST
jgi:hypothetical protein